MSSVAPTAALQLLGLSENPIQLKSSQLHGNRTLLLSEPEGVQLLIRPAKRQRDASDAISPSQKPAVSHWAGFCLPPWRLHAGRHLPTKHATATEGCMLATSGCRTCLPAHHLQRHGVPPSSARTAFPSVGQAFLRDLRIRACGCGLWVAWWVQWNTPTQHNPMTIGRLRVSDVYPHGPSQFPHFVIRDAQAVGLRLQTTTEDKTNTSLAVQWM